jgi:acrylyl-CoA reductase (NADPH)
MTDQATFNALVLDQADDKVTASIKRLDEAALPDGDVTVDIAYSTLNYKDGMVLGGIGRLVRDYPHIPGIDFAGVVSSSDSPDYSIGDPVVLTGWRVGEIHWGGYAQKARVQSQWLTPLPAGLTAQHAMALGTAGFTAMLAVMALEHAGLTPDQGQVLVTGANGGVGGVAVSILAKLGYDVAASTGRPEHGDHLRALGASEIIDRAELATVPERPMLKERWAGAVDAVGGATLSSIIAQLKYGGSVAACGLAGGSKLESTNIPFLLRGVNLLGIDSVMCPAGRRLEAWARLAREMPRENLESLTEIVPLAALPELGPKILKGEIRGRIVVDVNR